MLKNFDTPFLDFEGNPVKEEGKEITVRAIIISAIDNSLDNGAVTPEEKYNRYRTAMKISAGGDIDLTSEEIVMIKKCVGSGRLTPLAVGRVFDLLEA